MLCEVFFKNKTFLLILFFSGQGYASPWAEANDPFLRSDILALADAGYIENPVNAFPLSWSSVGVIPRDPQLNELQLAREHVLYQQASAKMNRGNRALTLSGCDDCHQEIFAAPSSDPASLGVSYEHASQRWAYRLSSQVVYDQARYDYQWDDSYVAWQLFDRTTFSLGYLPRWWGPSWQHNLSLNTDADELSFAATTAGQWAIVGAWQLTSLLSDVDYRWSSRIQAKPSSWFELGYSAHYWFERQTADDGLADDAQQSVDLQIALPRWQGISQRFYGEASTPAQRRTLGAYVVGWSGQAALASHALRLVMESQTVVDDAWLLLDNHLNIDDFSMKYRYKRSVSLASYVQLANDHQFSLTFFKQYDGYKKQDKNLAIDYQFPLLGGRLKIGSRFSSLNDQTFWSRYQFRY